MHNKHSGNALIIVLITIALFGALIFTFTRSGEQGTGNLSAQQSRMKAQDIASFFNEVDKAVQKLRMKGCSENDISFANAGDTASDIIDANGSATAPADESCHVFSSAGGKVIMNMNWRDYQVDYDSISAIDSFQYDQIYFKGIASSIVGVGTSENDLMAHFNFVQADICKAYNAFLGLDIDYSIIDTSPIAGDENEGYAGQMSFCRYYQDRGYGQIRYVWVAH